MRELCRLVLDAAGLDKLRDALESRFLVQVGEGLRQEIVTSCETQPGCKVTAGNGQ